MPYSLMKQKNNRLVLKLTIFLLLKSSIHNYSPFFNIQLKLYKLIMLGPEKFINLESY